MATLQIDQTKQLVISGALTPIQNAVFTYSTNILTIILDNNDNWLVVPFATGSVIVHIVLGGQSTNLPITVTPAPVIPFSADLF